MDCNIIIDLLPLYVDGYCSDETKAIVKKHLEVCEKCRKLFDDMRTPTDVIPMHHAPIILNKINDWKASVLQSVLLFLSFAVITITVALEANTPPGPTNGLWTSNFIIPTTGFMLSLANWYFVRLYRNRKVFSNYSSFATFGFTLFGYVWSVFHYKINLLDLLVAGSFTKNLHMLFWHHGIGIFLTMIFCIFSKFLSNQYAKMLGKE